MSIQYMYDLEQGTEEWHEARRGIITASEMKLLLTPTLKIANNEKTRSHIYELAAQRITGYVEPSYIGDDMLRGKDDEVEAFAIYGDEIAEVKSCGFITNSSLGFTLGYSPDGLVGDNGLIEIKSRKQKFHLESILSRGVPSEFMLQVQTGLLVSGREWLDFISFCGGMPMIPYRVYADDEYRAAIIEASSKAEEQIEEVIRKYKDLIIDKHLTVIETERRFEEEITASEEVF